MEVWGPQRNHVLIRSHLCAHQSSISNFGNGGVGIRGGSHTRGFLSILIISYSGLTFESTVTYSSDSTSQAGQRAVDQEMDLRMVAVTRFGQKSCKCQSRAQNQDSDSSVSCFLASGNDLCLLWGSTLPSISVYPDCALSLCVYLPTYLSIHLSSYLSIHTYM